MMTRPSEQRAELHLDRRVEQPIIVHRRTSWIQPDLVRGAHDADRIGRIGADKDEVGICRLHGAHHRAKSVVLGG